MKKITVLIGIPAFNEAGNIDKLLRDLSLQQITRLSIKKIVVYSDGSNDDTVQVSNKVNIKYPIKVIDGKKRHGQAFAQNYIINKSHSDILVLLNADIRIKDPQFLEKLCDPILKDNADLTSCLCVGLPPKKFLERILSYSALYKRTLFESHRKGKNIYTCVGIARAFSQNLYTQLQFKESVGEDAYSYLFATRNKFKYQYTPLARAYFKIPNAFQDHQKQSIRYIQSKTRFIEDFGKSFVQNEYSLPLLLVFFITIKFFIKNPVYMTFYIGIIVVMVVLSKFSSRIGNKWEIAKSSKKLNIQEDNNA